MNKELLYQDKKICYRVIGTGKPVVLIHGFGEDSRVWNNQIRPPQASPKEGLTENSFFKKFQFIIPDLPGSGRSEMIDDMSMEGMAEVIKTITETESEIPPPAGGGGGTACIIGHSMGGYITLAFAEKYPMHLNAFGLFHSTAWPDSEEKKAIRRKGIEFINQQGAFEFLKSSTPNLFSQQTKNKQPELVDEQIACSANFSPAALVSYYKAMIERPDRTETLRKAAVPVLFIMGKYDTAIPLEDGLKQCHLPEKSYIHILHQSGHMGMLEEPEISNRLLKKFLLDI